MILNKDTHPERDIYYLGAYVLDSLKDTEGENTLLNLYHRVNKKIKISLNIYMLALDWLFILGAVQFKNGYIKKCS